jgi:hypothetical protein
MLYGLGFASHDAISKFFLDFLQVLPQRIEVAVKFCDELLARGTCLLNDWVFPHQTAILRRDHHRGRKDTKKPFVLFVSSW